MPDVLVVDDDAAITEMVSEALALEGIPHRIAANGAEALTQVVEQRPCVILLDINMPVMDGVQFCATLAQTPGRDEIAIIVMTAARDVARFREACGAQDALGKPFHLDELYTLVERYLTPP